MTCLFLRGEVVSNQGPSFSRFIRNLFSGFFFAEKVLFYSFITSVERLQLTSFGSEVFVVRDAERKNSPERG